MDPTPTATVSVGIDAPIWRVFQNWKRFDRFPTFVPTVKEARWLSKTELYWREAYEGRDYVSTFEITVMPSGNSLKWRSLTGPASSGMALCEAQRDGGTQVTLTIDFQPDAAFHSAAAVRDRHLAFLNGFKKVVETCIPGDSEGPKSGTESGRAASKGQKR